MRERRTWPFSLASFADTAAYLCRVTFDGTKVRRSWFAPEYAPGKRTFPHNGNYDALPALPLE